MYQGRCRSKNSAETTPVILPLTESSISVILQQIMEPLPAELVFIVFQYIALNSCTTTGQFFRLVSTQYQPPSGDLTEVLNSPFTQLCKSLIESSELEFDSSDILSGIATGTEDLSMVLRIKKFKIKFESVPVRLVNLTREFVPLLIALVTSKSRFAKITAYQFPHEVLIEQIVYYCCYELHFPGICYDYRHCFQFSDLIRNINVKIPNFEGLKFLPKLQNLEVLGLVFVHTDQCSEDNFKRELQYIDQWVNLSNSSQSVGRMHVSITHWNGLLFLLVDFLKGIMEQSLLELTIELNFASNNLLRLLRPLQNHVVNLNNLGLDKLNLHTINEFSRIQDLILLPWTESDGGFDIELLNNTSLKSLQVLSTPDIPTLVQSIKNPELLTNLDVISITKTFSNFHKLKYLNLGLISDPRKNFISLPPKLKYLRITQNLSKSDQLFVIANPNELLYLRAVFVSISFEWNFNTAGAAFAEELQKCISSIPTSIIKLFLHCFELNWITLKFDNLVNLQYLDIRDLTLVPCLFQFLNSIEQLKLSIDLSLPFDSISLPPNVRVLNVTLKNTTNLNPFKNCIKNLKQLGVLFIYVGFIFMIDLEELLIGSIRKFYLEFNNESTIPAINNSNIKRAYGSSCTTIIYLPFKKHPDIYDLSIILDKPSRKAILYGKITEIDKLKLNLSPASQFIWRTNCTDEY